MWCVKMESNGVELDQIDEMDWIERRKHDLILRKYRQNTQRLVKEFQMKIQQQNHRIQQLAKQVKQQKFIIETFTNKTIETLDCHESQQQIVADSTEYVEAIVPDSEPTTIIYLDAIDVDTLNQGYQNIEVKNEIQPVQNQTKPKINRFIKSENTSKKLSLVSIQIQPNLRNSTNVYVCDECNKTMSSRRVLAKHKRMVHCAQKKFICDHCSKAFCVRDGLKRHLRIHTGEKPFVCAGCQKGFNQSGNMRIHEKTCKKYLKLITLNHSTE